MIIKAMRDDGPQKVDGPKMESWEYFDNISFLERNIVKDPKSSQELKDNYTIRFYVNTEQVVMNVMDYSKLFIMNDNGKTIETLRNI